MDLPQKQGLYDPRNEHDSCGVGFVVDIKGRKSHAIVRQGLSILVNLDHRGAVGADPLVCDGAGCLIQIPDALLRDWARQQAIDLPAPGHYAVAMCFLPQDEAARKFAVRRLEHFIKVEKQRLVGWRDVPTDTTGLGKAVIERMPRRRALGLDLIEQAKQAVSLDVALDFDPETAARYRYFFSPARYATSNLAAIRAMMIGLPDAAAASATFCAARRWRPRGPYTPPTAWLDPVPFVE